MEKSRNEVRALSEDDKTLPHLGSDSEGGESSDEDIDHGSDLRVEAVEGVVILFLESVDLLSAYTVSPLGVYKNNCPRLLNSY